MMSAGKRVWTESQQDAIQARRGTLLVSAAAGSGKTAVLVQRVMERLTDPVSPSDADRLLVVTFTNAAAQEMKERISQQLTELAEEHPEDSRLQRQQMLLPQARISTIHSFCSDLVREHFYQLEISPDFRILEDYEWQLLREQAMTQVLEEAYETASPDFQHFLEGYRAERNDRRMMSLIYDLYDFLRTHPFPKRWMKRQLASYEPDVPIGATAWGKQLLEYAGNMAVYASRLMQRAIYLSKQDERLDRAYSNLFSDELAMYQRLQKAASENDWDTMVKEVSFVTYDQMPPVRGYAEDPFKKQISHFRDQAKDAFKKLAAMFAVSEEDERKELSQLKPLLETLFDLTLRFSAVLDQIKRERKAADFNDLEHWTLDLLMREDADGNLVRTPEAIQLSEQFDEIMVDECQDINETQDMLFEAISQDGQNLFLVGDIKQSIYGFRQAMPQLFLKRRSRFPAYSRVQDQYPASLVLDRNFRSRETVVDSVNFLFRQLMSKQAGDVDYQGQEELVTGASYPEQPGYETRFDFVCPDPAQPDGAADEEMSVVEARHISTVISEYIESGFCVTSPEGPRPVQYGDFCILLRSANRYTVEYVKELQRNGIPARSEISPSFFETSEIAVMLSFLRVIDNPLQDISLLSVLMSPVYGFTADDLADIRLQGRDLPLYLALTRQGESGDERVQGMLRDLEAYRAMAATLPSDRMLERIYEQTGYRNMVQAMADGPRRLANLQLLLEYARKYESFGYYGISRFIQFLDRLQDKNFDLPSAAVRDGEGDAVRIMSIHRSKGLEFPICIVAGCDRSFNTTPQETIFHAELGVGMKLWSEDGFYRYNTLPRKAIALAQERESMSEELRVLYVAATRAREKLIFVSSVKKLEKRLASLAAQLSDALTIDPHFVIHASKTSDWLMLCALRHPDGQKLRDIAEVTGEIVQPCRTHWDIRIVYPAPCSETKEEVTAETVSPVDPVLLETLRQQADYQYPYEGLRGVPAKVTASSLTRQDSPRYPGESLLPRPSFLYSEGLTSSERGTALHNFLQFANYAAAAADPAAELEHLCTHGFLTKEQAQAVNQKQIARFFKSRVAKRILSSAWVKREYRFAVEIPASTVSNLDAAVLKGQKVLLQGAVDCVFEEGDGLVIVDYKSDRTETPEALWQAYHKQLELYAMAMEQCIGKRVKECLLYSFHWNCEIRAPEKKKRTAKKAETPLDNQERFW